MGPRVPSDNSMTGELVLSAITKLTTKTCWTARSIIKFIKMEFKITDPKLSTKVARALKKGVKVGLLEADQHRYRLRDIPSIEASKEKLCKPKQPRRPVRKRSKAARN